MASRRKFLQAVAGGALMARAVQAAKQAGGAPLGSVPKGKYKIPVGARVPMRRLGRTGADVSIVGLGGYHLGLPPEQEAIRMVQRALDHGMNFLDNCALCRARHNAHYADWRIMPTPMRSATERTERYAA